MRLGDEMRLVLLVLPHVLEGWVGSPPVGSGRLTRRMVAINEAEDEVTTNSDLGALSDDICLVPGEVMVRVEVAPGNARRIYCGVDIQAKAETIYELLTDYEALEEIVPNLVSNQVVARRAGGARLKQVGAAQVLPGLNFRASMILDVRELPEGIRDDELHAWTTPQDGEDRPLRRGVYPRPWATVTEDDIWDVAMQSVAGEPGDFTLYQGLWRAQPLPNCAVDGQDATRLTFAVEIQPRPWLPVALVESRIARDLVTNMEAVAKEAIRREEVLRSLEPGEEEDDDDDAKTREEEDLVATAKAALFATLDARVKSLVGATADAVAAIDRAAERLRQAGALDDQRVFDFETGGALKGSWRLRYSSDLARAFAARPPWDTTTSKRNKKKHRGVFRRKQQRNLVSSPRFVVPTPTTHDDDDQDDNPGGEKEHASVIHADEMSTPPATAAVLARLASRLALRSVDLEINERSYDLIVAFRAPGNLPPPAVRVEHLLIAPQKPFAATMVQERIRVEPLGGWSVLPRPAIPSRLFRPILDRSNVRTKLSLDVLYADDTLLVTRSDAGDLRVCERRPPTRTDDIGATPKSSSSSSSSSSKSSSSSIASQRFRRLLSRRSAASDDVPLPSTSPRPLRVGWGLSSFAAPVLRLFFPRRPPPS